MNNLHNKHTFIIFAPLFNRIITNKLIKIMDEERVIREEIKKLEKDLKDYLEILPYLDVSEKDSERVINFMLDDINIRRKKLRN